MRFLALPARQWRDRLQELLDTALEQGTILVYLRRQQPAYFIIPRQLKSPPEQYREYTRLFRMYMRVTEQARESPELNEPLPDIPANALRRNVNETLTTMKRLGAPFLLRRYDDVIGFVIPVPTGGGGMTFVKQLSIWYHSGDDLV